MTVADIAVGVKLENQERQEKLKESPGRFQLDKCGYSCSICGREAFGENSRFDPHGLKCRLCQQAIDQKEIPAWLGKARDTWTDLPKQFSTLKAIGNTCWVNW